METASTERARGSAAEVFRVFLKLGLTSFGGPIAHLGYFRDELVTRRQWLSDGAYAELVALCQFLPGPASSQLGFALGLAAIGLGALAGLWLGRSRGATPMTDPAPGPVAPVSPRMAMAALAVFAGGLCLLPLIAGPTGALALIDRFSRAGALVFGGGHVVLPLLQAETVAAGWVMPEAFLAGYGAAQAVPGPLFSFAAYLGAVLGPEPNGLAGAAIALCALFLPGFLILIAVWPFWERFRAQTAAQALLRGANAAVVGILGAALYAPVFTSAIGDLRDLALALACFVLLTVWNQPPWRVVILAALGGMALSL